MILRHKVCTKCKIEKSLEEYAKHASLKDGRQVQCRACHKAYNAQNKARIAAQRRDCYRKNPDRIKAKTREWYRNNRRAAIQYQAEYRRENAASLQEKDAKRHAKNKAAAKTWRHNRKARVRNSGERLSPDIVTKLLSEQNFKCPYCLGDLRVVGHHIDHYVPIILGGGNSDDNVQLTCPLCNLRKGSKHPMNFLPKIGSCH